MYFLELRELHIDAKNQILKNLRVPTKFSTNSHPDAAEYFLARGEEGRRKRSFFKLLRLDNQHKMQGSAPQSQQVVRYLLLGIVLHQ